MKFQQEIITLAQMSASVLLAVLTLSYLIRGIEKIDNPPARRDTFELSPLPYKAKDGDGPPEFRLGESWPKLFLCG